MTLYVDYELNMQTLFGLVQTAFPGRLCTRTKRHFSQHAPADMHRGVVTLWSDGIDNYPYEQGASEIGNHQIFLEVYGQVQQADEEAAAEYGPAIEAAEFAALRQVEILQTLAQSVDALAALKVRSVKQSGQDAQPYWFLAAQITNYPEGFEEDGP